MILLDALYINEGGGKILLDYLISRVRKENLKVVYLLDDRCKDKVLFDDDIEVFFMKATLKNRYKFYKNNAFKFHIVFCFGNLPPLYNIDSKVYTYLHQSLYLEVSKQFGLMFRSFFKLKQCILYFLKDNTNYWMVQNKNMKLNLSKKYDINKDRIMIVPFYPNNDFSIYSNVRVNDSFIYVSNATPNKNHKRLIEGFCVFYDKYKKGRLKLTVSSKYLGVFEIIKKKQKEGYPIENIGFVDHDELIVNYHKAEYLIFPSLEESFGLGIVEAMECGCKVIGADLPYMHQVCEPSILFNPKDVNSISEAFEKAINKKEVNTKQKIFNEIDQLISLLKE
ncbi:glycosyltransferase [Myroides odoratimimus]|uniref:glycosyltransferase n=1 Tax=Myroides odoratimimus TaxID=76832 RepID=UPI001CE1E734|nr:glycosyltransferase [Myroides odoratimimus]MCA4793875.1 glycosyltransferase [Myroides odoratimimus]MCA4821135.1 glycosyltransferase [Myroides odoratimimus]